MDIRVSGGVWGSPRTPLGAPAPATEPAWPDDDRGARGRLRAFLAAQPDGAHALLVGGARVAARAVAGDLAALARARGLAFAAVGPSTLRRAAEEGRWPLLALDALAAPDQLLARAVREAAQERSAGLCLLLAPTLASLPLLSAAEDALPASPALMRFCLVPATGLQQAGPQGGLTLTQRHSASFVLS